MVQRFLPQAKRFSTDMSNPIVSVKQGKLKGSSQKLFDGSTYYSFKGVPYAQPPIGKLRFKISCQADDNKLFVFIFALKKLFVKSLSEKWEERF
ncbi:hypothetical protein evm_012008 [Chilo suppressalis]|nr:hypothetical protein evm_012008 [Chilo suppressalis]